MKLQTLSVAENFGNSDVLAAIQESYERNIRSRIKFEVDAYGNVAILQGNPDVPGGLTKRIDFPKLDIDGLIEYLNDVKVFMREEAMYRKLTTGTTR